jgi:phosphatidylglycerophosphatase A
MHKVIIRFFQFLASGFYIGFAPLCPGTVASVAAVIAAFYRPEIPMLLELIIVAIATLLAIYISGIAARGQPSCDPSWIVIDEIVAMWLAVIPFARTWWWYALALLFFRFFDIKKFFPICVIETMLPGGWGIVLDDIGAAIFTIICLLPLKLIFWLCGCPGL